MYLRLLVPPMTIACATLALSMLACSYDGGGTGKPESDQLWTQEAAHRFHAVESNPLLTPDHAVFQSWARWPHKMLPETGPAR